MPYPKRGNTSTKDIQHHGIEQRHIFTGLEYGAGQTGRWTTLCELELHQGFFTRVFICTKYVSLHYLMGLSIELRPN